jgi:proline iminopeptidase
MKYFLFLFTLIPLLTVGQSKVITGFFSNGQAKISYTIFGEGKPLLVVNGGPGFSSNHMEGFAQALSMKGYKVILFDQRGTGKSIIPAYDSLNITVDLLVSDMVELLRVLGYKTISVMGHSFGGIPAMYFANKYPSKVDKLILCSSAGINLDFLNYFGDNIFQRLENVKSDTIKPVTIKEREEAFYRQVSNNAPAYFFNKENVPAFVKMLTVTGSYSPDYNVCMWTDLFRIHHDLSKKFTKFSKPTLVVQGRQDILGDETAICIHQAIKQSELHFINRCGHVPWMDAPESFYQLLDNFLAK